jgi:hypothetical protein
MNIAIDQLANNTLIDRKYIVLITDGQPTQREGCICAHPVVPNADTESPSSCVSVPIVAMETRIRLCAVYQCNHELKLRDRIHGSGSQRI